MKYSSGFSVFIMFLIGSCNGRIGLDNSFSEVSAVGSETTVAIFTESIYFKKNNKTDSELPISEKCLVRNDGKEYPLASYENTATNNTRLEFQEGLGIKGCSFFEGYALSKYVKIKTKGGETNQPAVYGATEKLSQPSTGSFGGFVFPTTTRDPSSNWCVYRSIGTSPHIGQDWRTVPAGKKSYALSDGKISSISNSGGCGWYVIFEDAKGASWKYLHLNDPRTRLWSGQKIKAGTLLGVHSTFPTPSCGSGPHLHLERLTPYVSGEKTGMNGISGYGTKNCKFNPNTPFSKNPNIPWSGNASFSLTLAAKAPANDVISKCAITQPEPTSAEPEAATAEGLIALASASLDSGGKSVLSLQAALAENPSNSCGENNEKRCISSISLFVRTSGGFVRIYSNRNVRNNAIKLNAEQGFCAAVERGSEYLIAATTNHEEIVSSNGTF